MHQRGRANRESPNGAGKQTSTPSRTGGVGRIDGPDDAHPVPFLGTALERFVEPSDHARARAVERDARARAHAGRPRQHAALALEHERDVLQPPGLREPPVPRRVAARDRHKGLYLWVFERNEAAVGFYRALGGEIAERLISDWDKAPDEIRYRMHWPNAADLARR